MAVTPFKNTLKGGKQRTYYKVKYRDEFGHTKSRSFTDKGEAKEFDRSIGEVIRQKRAALAVGADPDQAVQRKVLSGELNSEVVERTISRHIGPTMKIRDAIIGFVAACKVKRENHKVVRPQTAKTYEEKMYLLRDTYGDTEVGRFDRDKAKEYRDLLVEKKASDKQAKNCMVVAKMMFQWLIDDKKEIKENPFAGLRIVSADEDDIVKAVDVEDIFTDDEIAKLMDAAWRSARGNMWPVPRAKDLAVVALMVYCGLRLGEALAVEWMDVDLKDKVVRVKQTLVNKTGEINATKTKSGLRRIALHPKVIEALQFAKTKAVGKYVSSVAPSEDEEGDGGPTRHRNMARTLVRLIKDAEITQRSPHSLRHYFASKLIDAGYDGMALRQQMGHADLSFTNKVYGHLLNKHTRVTKDVERMSAVEFA